MIGYIYSIINRQNGKRYVGQTINIDHRLARHLTELRHGYHHSHKLQRAFNKYGEDSFTFEYNEYQVKNEQELYQLEIDTIKKYDSYYNGYNETFGGEGTPYKIDFYTSILVYQIGQRYSGVIHKLARYFDCDRTTIKDIFNRKSLANQSYSQSELNQLIEAIGLTDDNLIENYHDNFSRRLTTEQVLGILSTLELTPYSQSACAKAAGVNKDVVNTMVRGRTYKQDKALFQSLSKAEKEKYCKDFCDNTDVESIHYVSKRAPVKNPLTQEQIDFILDSEANHKTQNYIATQLNISKDRVSSVLCRQSYIDLIHNYELRHSS